MSKTIHQARTIVPGTEIQHLAVENYGTVDAPAFLLRVFNVDDNGRQQTTTIYLDRDQWAELSDAAQEAFADSSKEDTGSSEHLDNSQVEAFQARKRAEARDRLHTEWLNLLVNIGPTIIVTASDNQAQALREALDAEWIEPSSETRFSRGTRYVITDKGRIEADRRDEKAS